MFQHTRSSANGTSIPTWLRPGPIYVKRHVRNKDDPLVDEAELLEINPNYAHVRLSDGRETTVSIRDLSPRSNEASEHDKSARDSEELGGLPVDVPPTKSNQAAEQNEKDVTSNTDPETIEFHKPPLRRSTRVPKPVDRYGAVPYV